jgi:hypothetical protein
MVMSMKLSALLPAELHIDPAEMSLGQGKTVSATMLSFVGTKVQDAIASSLDIDVLELIAEAWAKTGELRELCEGERRSEAQHVFLAKHDVECESRVKVLVEFAGAAGLGASLAPVTDELRLILKAKFEGIGLTIDKGFIVAVDAGKGAAQAELRYSNAKLVATTSGWVELPAKHTLRHPIQIGGQSETNVVPLRPEPAAA